jgi:pimeloyl-ACP methyl ester carboxylesterase
MRALPLVLLPGMMCDRRQWAPQIAGMVDVCNPIVVGDLTRDATVGGMAATVLAAAPPRFALAGLSMGGIVAFEIWRQAPDRVTHLALLDTNARPDAPERQQIRMEQIGAVLGGRLRSIVVDELKPAYLAARNRANQPLLDLIVAMAIDLGPSVFERQSLALKSRGDSRPTLRTIACPTLVLHGAEDMLCTEEDHRVMAAGISGARYVVVPDCGHLSTLESPDAVTAALRSLLAAPHPAAVPPFAAGVSP